MARKKISTNPLIRSTRAQELKNRLEWFFEKNKIKREQIKKSGLQINQRLLVKHSRLRLSRAVSLIRMASKAPAVNERQHY